ncbi:MAG: hypothetical protein DRI90_12530, partial [Deltaproteobacteria bacterium]
MGRGWIEGAWLGRGALAAWVLAALLVSSAGRAERLKAAQVPAELREWIPWVLDEVGDDACTLVEDQRVCAWLGRLSLEVSATGGSFRLQLLTERSTRVPLPGSSKHWPVGVKVGAERGVVLDVAGVPSIALPAGRHTVEGRFSWRKLPDLLPVPGSVARVTVKTGDRVVTSPRREADGSVWLGGSAPGDDEAGQAEPERLEIEVMRRIEDGVPLVVTTRIGLRVGGRPREVRLAPPLLEGGVLLELEAQSLPAHFEQDGVLVLEAKKGKHTVLIRERHSGSIEALELRKRAEPWPSEEVWAWEPNVALRQTEVAGGAAIDPSRTNLPERWRKLQAFKLRAPASFTVKTLRRGNPEPPPNHLGLRRSLWLDLDGGGYTVVDYLSGRMRRDWRLSFVGQGELGQVGAPPPVLDHLITVDPATEKPGVELRQGAVDLFAEWRGEGMPTHLAAVGWTTDVESLQVAVRLPPGWELLGASGADTVSPSRLSGWDALDLLWIFIIAAAAGKLGHWRWAPLAALVMALCHESPYAPWWAWGGLIGTMALLHYLPEGRLQRASRVAWWGASAVLIFGLVSFAALEVRALLYPHAIAEEIADREVYERETEQIAEEDSDNREGGAGTRARGEEGAMGESLPRLSGNRYGVAGPADNPDFGMVGVLNAGAGGDPDAPTAPWGRDDSLGISKKEKEKPADQAQQDPKAVIQTGHGVPRWRYSQSTLRWVGPVEQGHQIRLWLLSPTMRAGLTALAIALAAWLSVLLLRRSRPGASPTRPKRSVADTAVVAALVGAVTFGASLPAQAAAPSKELLDELKTRLTRPPECSPGCVTVGRMTARASGHTLELVAEVHVGATASYQLPGPAESWVPTTIEVDGKPSRVLVSLKGYLHLRLGSGTHEVKLAGPIAGDELTLTLGTVPHSVQVEAEGWEVDGVDRDGHADSSIHWRRAVATESGDGPPDETPTPEAAPKTLSTPPWLEV